MGRYDINDEYWMRQMLIYQEGAARGAAPDNNLPGRAPFGELRVASKYNLFNSKLLGDTRPLLWSEGETAGTGTGTSYNANSAINTMTVSASTAGTRVRKTFQPFNYQPGNGQQILLTFILGAAEAGITRRVGYFDDKNGVFLEQTEDGLFFVVRSYVSGAPVDTRIPQASWSINTLGGINPANAQILWIDIESLQVGSVRWGFVIDGVLKYCHSQNHANRINTTYFGTPNLPARFEISNNGTGGAATLQCICVTVNSEGGQPQDGITRRLSTGATPLTATTAGTIYALFGVRLKTTHLDNVIRFRGVSAIAETNDDFEWMLILNATVAGTFTFADVANSAIQSAVGTSSNTVTGGTELAGDWVQSGTTAVGVPNTIRTLGTAYDGTRDTMTFAVRARSNNAVISASLIYSES